MHLNSLFLPVLICSTAIGIQGKKGHTQEELGENIDSLSNTFTKEEMYGMIGIIEFLKLKNPPHTITKEQASSQEDHTASIDKKFMLSLSGSGPSKSDLEEIVELARVMKVPDEKVSIEDTSEDVLQKLSEMTPGDLEMVKDKSFMSESLNKKVVTRRDAESEPGPEPEPYPEAEADAESTTLPSNLLADFYHPYAVSQMRVKRAQSGFKLRLKGKGFRKNRDHHKKPLRKQPSFQHQQDTQLINAAEGKVLATEERSNVMVGESKVRYGKDLWRSDEGDSSDHIINKVEANNRGLEVPNNARKKRYVMEAVMGMLGMEEEEEEPDEVLYMSAMLDGHMHEVMKTPTYQTPESFKRTMARAKLIKTHS